MKKIHAYLMMLFIVLAIFISPAIANAEDNIDSTISEIQVETNLIEEHQNSHEQPESLTEQAETAEVNDEEVELLSIAEENNVSATQESIEVLATQDSNESNESTDSPVSTTLRQEPSVSEESDLTEFLTDVEIDATQDENGNYVIRPNGEYAIKLKFAETPTLQLANNSVLNYSIPTAFSLENVANTTFDINIIDSNGSTILQNNIFRVIDNVLYVEFNKSDADTFARLAAMANVSFAVGLKGKFAENITEIQFNSKVKKTFTYDQTSSLTIMKDAVHANSGADMVDYTLKVISEGNNSNVEITDTIVGTALTLNRDVVVVSNKSGTLPIVPIYDGDRFTLSNISLSHKEELTITYSAAINFDELKDSGTAEQTKNIATVKSEENPTPKMVEKTVKINFQTITKNAGQHTLVPGETHKYYVPWTVKLNSDHKLTIGGLKIVDNLSIPERSWFTGTGIKVTVTKVDGSVEVRDLTWADLTVRRRSPNNEISGWDYIPPVLDGKAAYVIETMTIIDTTGALGNVVVNNAISVGKHITTPNKTINVNVGEELKPKKKVVSYDSQEINWVITIPVPETGYNVEVRVIDDMPYTIYQDVMYHDALVEMNIRGLLPGETYTINYRMTGQYRGPDIQFYQNPEKTIRGLKANPSGQMREIMIEIRSKVNQEWLEKAHENGYKPNGGINPNHVNNASLRLAETRFGMNATALPKKQGIKKAYNGKSKVELEGTSYPVFSYSIELTNPLEGEIVYDAFDTNFLKFYREGNLIVRGRNSSSDVFDDSGSVTVQDSATGINIVLDNLPKKAGKLYQYYVIEYDLIVKDKTALTTLNGFAFQNDGVTLTNIAKWKEMKSEEVSAIYNYNPILDKSMTQVPNASTGYVATFELILNEGRGDVFPDAQTYTVKDQLSSGLRLIPDSIRVTKGNYTLDFGFDPLTNTIVFNNIPDDTEVRIVYDARVLGTGDVSFSNTVSLGEYVKTVESSTTISATGSGSASNPSITLVKRDRDDFAKGLEGAKFKLSYLNGTEVVDVLDKNGRIVTFTTNAEGKALIEGNQSDLGWVLWADGRTYLLTEIEAPVGYMLVTTPVKFILADTVMDNTQYAIYGETLYVSNERPKVTVEATKSWHNIGPTVEITTIWFKLFRKIDGGELEEVPNVPIKALTSGTTTVVWENLYAQDLRARAYTFFVKEVDMNGNDFTPKDFIKEENGLHVSNTYDGRIEMKVTKTWDDTNNQDGKRPDKIVVTLFANNEQVTSVEVTATSDWTHTFTNLPKYKDGQEIVYTITEEAVAGYEAPVIDQFHIVNKRTPETVEVKVTKKWDDANNQDGKRPDKIVVTLFSNNEQVTSAEVTATADWAHTFTNLPKYKDGQEIVYTITEEAVAGYEAPVIDQFHIVNKRTPETVEVKVTKKWDDANNQGGKRPDTITVRLHADAEDTGSELLLSEANNWQGTFSGLAKYKDGQEITYTIVEVSVEGYETSIEGSAIEGFVVTNTYVPPIVPPTPPPMTPPKPQLPRTGEEDTAMLVGLAIVLMLTSGILVILSNKQND